MTVKINWFRVIITALFIFSVTVIVIFGFRLNADDGLKIYLDLFSAFIASLFGALAAFSLQMYREKIKNSKNELGDINLLILCFIQRLDTLRAIRQQLIVPIRHEHARHLLMRPATIPWPKYEVNYSSLTGFLGEGLGGHVIRISMLDQKYRLARDMVELHGNSHLEYQDIMSKSVLKNRSNAIDSEIREVIGEKLWQTLELAGNQMIETVDEAFDELRLFLEEFPPEFKKRHKKSWVIAYVDAGPNATGSGMI